MAGSGNEHGHFPCRWGWWGMGAKWAWDVGSGSQSDCVRLSSAALVQWGYFEDIKKNNLSGSFLDFSLKNPPASPRHFNTAIPAHTQSDVFTLQPRESTDLTSDLFTNCSSQLIKLSHTYTPPLLPFKPSVLACSSLSPLSHHPLIFYCHLATWLSAGCEHRRHSWRRLRSKAFTQTAGLLWSLHRSPLQMHYLSEQVSWHRELVILRRS